jgi:glycolate oxidase
MRSILSIDPLQRTARVEPGVVNLELSRAAAAHGLEYAPDPSSQAACTLGGNFAGNSGGPHCLKYGVTLPHVLGARVVTPQGEIVELGGECDAGMGVDQLGLLVGSEGTAGVVVELCVRLVPLASARRTMLASFDSIEDAARTVSEAVAAGILPAALELIDRVMLEALRQAFDMRFPEETAATLLIELDGAGSSVEHESERVREFCSRNGARELRVARDEAERAALWKARKHAFGAVGRISPNYATQDGVVPRARLPEICGFIQECARRHALRIGVVVHAGDGNLHPAILYDERDADSVDRALLACGEILERCIDLGGSPTGEHGVGMEKREFLPRVYGPDEMEAQAEIKRALDPSALCNPHKVLPGGTVCRELRVAGRQVPM